MECTGRILYIINKVEMIMFIKDIVIRNKLFAKTAVIYKDIGHTYNELYTDCN